MFSELNVMVKNTQRYLEFINFCLGASGVVRQNLQNSNTAFQVAESSVRSARSQRARKRCSAADFLNEDISAVDERRHVSADSIIIIRSYINSCLFSAETASACALILILLFSPSSTLKRC